MPLLMLFKLNKTTLLKPVDFPIETNMEYKGVVPITPGMVIKTIKTARMMFLPLNLKNTRAYAAKVSTIRVRMTVVNVTTKELIIQIGKLSKRPWLEVFKKPK